MLVWLRSQIKRGTEVLYETPHLLCLLLVRCLNRNVWLQRPSWTSRTTHACVSKTVDRAVEDTNNRNKYLQKNSATSSALPLRVIPFNVLVIFLVQLVSPRVRFSFSPSVIPLPAAWFQISPIMRMRERALRSSSSGSALEDRNHNLGSTPPPIVQAYVIQLWLTLELHFIQKKIIFSPTTRYF